MHNRWRLEFDTSLIPDYEKTLRHVIDRVSESCRWTNRGELTDTWESAIMITAPIFGPSGSARGMCGLELSSLYLGLAYPAQDSEYGSMVTVIAPGSNGVIDLSRGLTGELDAIKANGAIEDNPTGISEIDALVSILDTKAASLKPGLLPPDVASLLDEFLTRFATLTATERKIVGLYAEGMEAGNVAEHMFISIHTVRKHNANIYRKLNVGSREELVLYLELFRRCKKLDELFGEEAGNETESGGEQP